MSSITKIVSGPHGATGSIGPTGPTGPSPSGTGIVTVDLGNASTLSGNNQLSGFDNTGKATAIDVDYGLSLSSNTLKLTGATGPAGGDLALNYPNPKVVGLQGRSLPNISPSNGQVLQWNGSEWVPGAIPHGGSGGGGIIYFLNNSTLPQSPTTGLSAPTIKQLSTNPDIPLTSITKSNISTGGVYDEVAGFVTDVNKPGALAIPTGVWDFNIWASSSASANQIIFRLSIYKYDGSSTTLIDRSDLTYLYNPSTDHQYVSSVTIQQESLLVTDRIYIVLEVTATTSGLSATFYFGDDSPSHVHTSISSVQGSGVVHVINGVVQSPATPVTLSSSDVIGVLPVSNGGTGLSSAPSNGQLLIGNGTGFTETTLTAGSGISVTNGSGIISLANTGALSVGAISPISSSGGQNPTISLDNSGVFANTYGTASSVGTFTVNSKGLITSAVNASIAIDGSQIVSGSISIPIIPLRLGTSGIQSITSATTQITPTGSYHRITNTTGGNITLSTAQASINWVGAVAGQMLIIQMVVVAGLKNVVLSRGAATKLALDGATASLSPGATITFIYDGTLWVETAFINGTSAP